MPFWIDSDSALADFISSIPDEQPVALDTEFQWTSTYYPVLALLQIGISRERVGVVDALAIRDWQPLSKLLSSEKYPIILFSGINDLPLLIRACGGPDLCLPQKIFDVQCASSFCGGTLSPALKSIVESELGIVLDKHETRSDWTRRPLTPSQISYAAGDVALLPELALRFSDRLSSNGNLAAFQEEMEVLCQRNFYLESPADDAWHRVRNFTALPSDAARARARMLAAWREETARKRDLPRNWILSDEQLQWLAVHNPKTGTAMSQMPCTGHGAGRHGRDAMMAAMAQAVVTEDDRLPPPIRPQTREKLTELKKRLSGLVASRAEKASLPPELLASKRELETIVLRALMGKNYRNSRIFTGWRARLLQPALNEILSR